MCIRDRGGAGNRLAITIQDGQAVIVPVVKDALKAVSDSNIAAFAAVAGSAAGQTSTIAALVDLAKTQSANTSGAETSRAGMYAAAAVAAAVLLMRRG
jgi:hypothetical protein